MAGTLDGFETAIGAWAAAAETMEEIAGLESRLQRELMDVADGIAMTIHVRDGDNWRRLETFDELEQTPVGWIDGCGRRIEACQYAKWLSSDYSLDDLERELEGVRERGEEAIEETGPNDECRERLAAGWPARKEAMA